MIILIVVVAFALMFRSKLGGSEVVKIQSAIPGIVMAMVLIPLSYPICGLFIDAVTPGTNIIHDWAFSPSGPGYATYQAWIDKDHYGNDLEGQNREFYADDWRVDAWSIKEYLSPFKTNGIDIAGTFTNILTDKGGTGSNLLGEIVTALLYIVSIFTSLKIIVKLAQGFMSLFVAPMLAPFVFATLQLPGQGHKSSCLLLSL
jgi:hypothetical protein